MLDMWVKDYMSRNFYAVSPDETIFEAVKSMVSKKTNSAVVVDGKNNPIGILSSYTLVKAVVPAYLKDDPIYSVYGAEGTFEKYAKKIKNKKVKDIMYTEFHVLKEGNAMIEAASFAVEASRRILPVVNDENKVIGIINRTSIKNALYDAIKNGEKSKEDNRTKSLLKNK